MKNRLEEIYLSASKLFINKGYSRTQMKDIAKDIGLSTGMLYIYFTSKKDVLSFTLKATVDPSFMNHEYELPLNSEVFIDLNKEIKDTLDLQQKEFSEILKNGVDSNSFEKILSNAFDIIAKYGKGILIIENNPDDIKKIWEYYHEYRRQFFVQMLEYINILQKEGYCRKMKYVEYSTQLIIETLSWWGMHVMNKAYAVQPNIDIKVAKEVCLDNLLTAYEQ